MVKNRLTGVKFIKLKERESPKETLIVFFVNNKNKKNASLKCKKKPEYILCNKCSFISSLAVVLKHR